MIVGHWWWVCLYNVVTDHRHLLFLSRLLKHHTNMLMSPIKCENFSSWWHILTEAIAMFWTNLQLWTAYQWRDFQFCVLWCKINTINIYLVPIIHNNFSNIFWWLIFDWFCVCPNKWLLKHPSISYGLMMHWNDYEIDIRFMIWAHFSKIIVLLKTNINYNYIFFNTCSSPFTMAVRLYY